jgi:hypothetical protein
MNEYSSALAQLNVNKDTYTLIDYYSISFTTEIDSIRTTQQNVPFLPRSFQDANAPSAFILLIPLRMEFQDEQFKSYSESVRETCVLDHVSISLRLHCVGCVGSIFIEKRNN